MNALLPSLAAHVVRAEAARVAPDDQRAACDGTDRRIGVGVAIANALGREPIDVRRLRVFIAVAADPVMAVVFAGQPQDVGAVLRGGAGYE